MIGLVFGAVAACGARRVGKSSSPTGTAGAWAERVQVIYLSQSHSVVARPCRVWDPHPEKNLDFVWEPATGTDPGIAADGTINGKGKLVWRVRGSASYDPKTIYSVYAGEMRDGRPNGNGRLEIRSGEVFDGDWSNGLLSKARASISTPTATATKACSRQASPMARGACSPAPARYSKASSATA